MTINTILFDLDGTLIDSIGLIIKSYQHTFNKFLPEKSFSASEIVSFTGYTLWQIFDQILPEKTDEMVECYKSYNLAHHDDEIKLFPGVAEGLEKLSSLNIKMGIISSKIHDTVLRGLKVTGIDKHFAIILGADDVEEAKPNPEGILKALKFFNSQKQKTLMVGDNEHDIEAGINASVKTCLVYWTMSDKTNTKANYILKNMNDLLTIAK
ncbi:MAG: pyrophosphatase PpaX [Pseudomonadota bacterium]